MEPNIGINAENRHAISASLVQVLAESYALYQMTHLYHWNVQGPRFGPLHQLFSDQYTEIWTALDEIAERIRALGLMVPDHKTLLAMASIPAPNDASPTEDVMLKALLVGQESVVRAARTTVRLAADGGDDASADLMTERCAAGEKAAWMLRAHLG